MVRLALVVGIALAACQGGGSEPARGGSGTASGTEVSRDSAVGFGTGDLPDAGSLATLDGGAKLDEPEPADPGKLIAELGAVPAWQAVVDRARYLARRGLRGVVYGRIGPAVGAPPVAPTPPDAGVARPADAGVADAGAPDAAVPTTPYVWLVDDTDGNGTLGIRVLLGKHAAAPGDRVAIGGAWFLDDDRRWYWKADALQPLPPAAPSDVKDPPPAVPSHAIADGTLPAGARTITVARDHDAVYFQIVGPPPVRDGEGWLVANELGDTPFAYLILPGERPSYGGQDMRAADERWQLKRAQTYWVRIGKIRKYGPDKPAVIHARTAPVRVN